MPEHTHLRIILHGKAAGREDVRTAIQKLRSKGHEVTVRVTWEGGDAARYALEALSDAAKDGIDTLVAGGGDGTLNQVVGAVCEEVCGADNMPFSFGLLPLGTANDFAWGIGLDPRNIAECLWIAATGSARVMDLGKVNDRIFVNVATGGFGTRVTTETDSGLKRILGGAAYFFTGLNRFSELANCSAEVTGENLSWQGEFLAIAAGNGRQAGGGVPLCPDAKLDDGLLDLTIVPSPERDQVPDLIGHLMDGGLEQMRRYGAVTARMAECRIETREDLQINLDGEPVHGRSFSLKALPSAVRFRRP
ncbi:lipid kinase YegS [Roseibium litorale]|uniref:Lipid kinase YegS n=1 Tax=Roseibium litorale TaxID=2803841 RepID=A0ABR9CNT5_9HYPH|nr:lipid kinase YegS [Roseibium litorale]MBD8891926.1 lipid kinase YegS [Roseibium litorale]